MSVKASDGNSFTVATVARRRFLLGPRIGKRSYGYVLAVAATLTGLMTLFVATASAEVVSQISRDEDATLTATASTSLAQVAEPLTLELKLQVPAGAMVSFPKVSEQLGDWDVMRLQDAFDIPNGNQRTWTRTLTLETIQTGDVEIPSIEVVLTASDTTAVSPRSVATKPIRIRVLSVLEDRADPKQFRDIQSVVDVPVPAERSYAAFAWIAVGTAFGVSAMLLVASVLRHRNLITARQWAVSEIESLVGSHAMQLAESETVLLRLSEVLREYLELQFGISAPMQTTEEVLSQVRELKLMPATDMQRFSEIFASADQAKFAGLKLSRARLESLVAEARAAVLTSAVAGEAV